jgi:hypothetical protein
MSYASAVKASFSFPAKYGWFLAGWAYLCTWTNVPPAGALLQQCSSSSQHLQLPYWVQV